MSELLKRAQQTLEEKQKKVNPEYKPRYHLSVPAGWLNDPNGFGHFQGRYHLYYQYHPYDTVWGPMHWGHWSSHDLINWTQEPVAMAPDSEFDAAGCFSGTALDIDGVYHVMYTGVIEETSNGRCLQQQCLAVSKDGARFTKAQTNPVVGQEMLPPGASPYDFRDPKLEKMHSGYRIITASRGEKGGQLLSFVSQDMYTWHYEGVYADGLCEMAECPDCFEIDGQRMVIVCLMGNEDERLGNKQPVIYMTGMEENGRFCADSPARDVDRGLDFYAPQTCLSPDGRRILIGWAFSWGHTLPTHTLNHGWAGTMTLPRECTCKNGRLFQLPAREIESMRKNETVIGPVEVSQRISLPACNGPCQELLMQVDMSASDLLTLHLMETQDEHFSVTYNKHTAQMTADRACCGYPLTHDASPEETPFSTATVHLKDNMLTLRIFVDVSIIEIYAGDGEVVMTCQAFPKGKTYGVSVSSRGTAKIAYLKSYTIA